MLSSVSLLPLLLPVLLTLVGGLAVLVAEPFLDRDRKHAWLPWIAALTAAAALASLAIVPDGHVHGLYAMDGARTWLCAAILAATAISLGGLQATLSRDRYPGGEPYALLMLAAAGAQLMAMSTDYLALFIGIEMASLSVYALVGLRRDRPDSNEGLYKYFVMGSVFSAIFLYGVAMTYGATGSTGFGAVADAKRQALFLFGQTLVVVGLLFKVGAVPFHFWSPDAYTGAPAAITGFMGAVIKVGGFAALGALWLCLLGGGGEGVRDLARPVLVGDQPPAAAALLQPILLIVAILSIFLGHLSGLGQRSVRRLVAYSSIANAGYLLLAFALPAGAAAVSLHGLWVYLVGYAIATAGLLTVIAWMAGPEDQGDDLASLAGQARRAPLHGAAATVFLASLVGLPPTVGFLGKFLVLADLVAKGKLVVAVVAMLFALVGAAYYLSLLAALWSPQPTTSPAQGRGRLLGWTVAAAAIALVALCWPGVLVAAQPTAASVVAAAP
jgi:NADH-quinone oxidoreductase subunit N